MTSIPLTNFKQMFYFYTLLKPSENRVYVIFSGGIKTKNRCEMGEDNNWLLYYHNYHFKKVKITEQF